MNAHTPDDWDDRALDTALHELHGSKPPDLSSRVLAALHEEPRGPLPRLAPGTAPRPRGPSPLLLLAALLLGAVVLGFAAASACYWLVRPAGSASGDTVAALLDVEVVRGEIAGSELRTPGGVLAAPARGAFVAKPGSRLRSAGEFVFHLGPFGTLSAPATSELEVRSMELTTKHGIIAASSLTLAVVAGVVTWHSLPQSQTATAGEVLHMQAQAGGGEGVAALTAENTALRERIAELGQQVAALQAKIVDREAAPAPPKPVPVEPVVVDAETAAAMAFSDPKYADALGKVDWKALGETTSEMAPMLAELVQALSKEGAEIPVELAGKIQQLNGQIIAKLPAMLEVGVPGTGANGTYSHPLITSNILASTLTAAGHSLTPAQQQQLDGLVAAYTRENQAIADGPREFELEEMLAEVDMKDRFYREVGNSLTPEQAAAIFPEGGNAYDGGCLFSSGLVTSSVARPVPAKDAAEFARAATRLIADDLELDDATAAQVRTLLEHHAAAPELWRDRADRTEKELRLLRSGRTKAALRQQIQWMRVLSQQVSLTPEQRKKLLANKTVLVPLPK